MLAIAVNRIAGGSASTSAWLASGEEVKHAIPRQALPFVWDFGESNCLATASRSWDSALNSMTKVLEGGSLGLASGQVQSADATNYPLPDQSAGVWFTDPPYYDAIPYADLSDFFLVWLKRTLRANPMLRDPFDTDNPLSPKAREIVQDESKNNCSRRKDRRWFEETMAKAFAEGYRILSEDGVGSVVFAHKTTEGWEALLSGMISGWLDHHRLLAHCYGDARSLEVAGLRGPRHQRPLGLPPPARGCARWRLGRRSPRTARSRRRLDAAAPG